MAEQSPQQTTLRLRSVASLGAWRGYVDARQQLWSPGPARLAAGTILLECAAGKSAGSSARLIDTPDLRLSLDAATLTIDAQGKRAQLKLGVDGGALQIGLTWQADRGRLVAAAWHGLGAARMVELPWCGALDAEALWASRTARALGLDGLSGAALSGAVEPLGPLGGIDPGALIETPYGSRSVRAVRPGDMVHTADGDLAQIRWAGAITLPTFTTRAPMRLRAPYLGLERDLVVSPQETLRIEGTDVEYLFGTHAVRVPVGAIARDAMAVVEPHGPFATLTSIVLDRPAALIVNGAALQRPDSSGPAGAASRTSYDCRAIGLCGRIPVALWPGTQGSENLPVLRREEMRMLLNFRAA